MEPSIIKTLDTKYPADSVEVIPFLPNIAAVGTYQLLDEVTESNRQKRIGTILLYEYVENEDKSKDVKFHSELNHSAVFDLKWCRHALNDKAILCIANTDGCVVLQELNRGSCHFNLTEVSTLKLDERNLVCSVDWSTNKFQNSRPKIVSSDSGGLLSLMQTDSAGELKVEQQWRAHDAEAWVCAFDGTNPNIVYSGGDDCKLKTWDTRMNPISCPNSSKRHDMGVTSIHDNIHHDVYFASGSYDENLRLWDKRNMRNDVGSVALGGGVWRIKWHPHIKDLMLAACMHDGFKVVSTQLDHDNKELKTLVSYTDHESLAYGVDWFSPGLHPNKTELMTVASCSFYDKRFDVWEFQMNT